MDISISPSVQNKTFNLDSQEITLSAITNGLTSEENYQ